MSKEKAQSPTDEITYVSNVNRHLKQHRSQGQILQICLHERERKILQWLEGSRQWHIAGYEHISLPFCSCHISTAARVTVTDLSEVWQWNHLQSVRLWSLRHVSAGGDCHTLSHGFFFYYFTTDVELYHAAI